MSKIHKILPCPCCGEEARVFKENSRWFDFFLVMCTECGLKTNSFNSPEEAVEKWNKRKGDECEMS